MKFLTFFFIAVFASVLFTPKAISRAVAWGLVDVPDERKRHPRPTPLTGGLVLYPISVIALLTAYGLSGRILIILAALTVVTLSGIWDDLKGSHRLTKLFWQIVAAILVISSGVLIDFKSMAFIRELGLETNGVESAVVTLIWIVGITNAVNLVDGMDGLAAGLSLNAFVGVGALAMVGGHPDLALLCAIMAGSIVGYLKYNTNPAKTFLGDSGSLLLGFMISVVSIMHATKATTFVVLVIPILFISIPMTDTVFAFFRRAFNGKNPFVADRGHIHHRLLDMKFSHKQTVGYFYTFSVVLACLALLLAQIQASHILALALFCVVAMVALVKTLQVYNFHEAVARVNRKLAELAKSAVGQDRDNEGYTLRAVLLLLLLFLINAGMSRFTPAVSIVPIQVGAALLLALGFTDLFLTAEGEGSHGGSIIHMTLFFLTLLFQLELYLHWQYAVIDRVNLTVMTILLVSLVITLILRTRSFVVFLDEPMEILTLFMGLVLCALAKHYSGAVSIFPYVVIMTNTVCLYYIIKMVLLGVHMKSRIFATGTITTSFLLTMMPWFV